MLTLLLFLCIDQMQVLASATIKWYSSNILFSYAICHTELFQGTPCMDSRICIYKG
jgi:hypothetical protein